MIRSVWWKSKLFWVLLLLVLYLLVGIIVVPPIVKNLLKSTVTAESKLDPKIKTVKFDPITYTLRLRNMRLLKSDSAVLNIDGITVNFDPLTSLYRWDLSFSYVEIQSPAISVTRDKNGAVNWTQFYDRKDTSAESSSPADPSNYSVDQFRLKNGKINWLDRSQSPEAHISLSELDTNFKNLHWPIRENSSLDMRSTVGKSGVFRARGLLHGDSGTFTSDFTLTNFSLRDANQYLRTRTRGQLKSGKLDFNGSLQVSTFPFEVTLMGESEIKDVLLISQNGDPVAGWKKGGIHNIDLSWPQREFRVGPIEVREPRFVMKIGENYSTNLGQLLVSEPEESTDNSTKNPTPWTVSVGPVRVTDANLNFTDVNVPGTFQASIKELSGSIGEVNTAKNDTAGLSLAGTLGDQSTVSLNGSIKPFSFSSSSKFNLKIANMGLPSLSQYSSKFLGYKIDRGKLQSNFEYELQDGQLTGENHVVLEEFILGKYVGNAVVAIPMRLAVALLKDSNGVITLDVPVSGNMNDPSFNFSSVIYQSVRSALINVVKSPFSYLADMVDSEAEDLKYVEFEPTKSKLTDRAREGLSNLGKLLKKRPLINVGIRPGWTEIDRQKLAKKSLDNYLNREGGDPVDLTQSVSRLERRFTNLASAEALSELRKKHAVEEVNLDTKDPEAYVKELYRLLLKKTEVNTDILEAIAQERALNIREFLREYEIRAERFFLLDSAELDTNLSDSVVKIPLTVDN